MGQLEIYEFLKRNKGKWMSAREITNKVGISYGCVGNSLKKLRGNKQINFRFNFMPHDVKGKRKIYEYKFKGR